MSIASPERGIESLEQAYALAPEEIAKANNVWDKLIRIGWPELVKLPLNLEGLPNGAISLHESLSLVMLPGRVIERQTDNSQPTMEWIDSLVLETVAVKAKLGEQGSLSPVMSGKAQSDYGDSGIIYSFDPFDEHRFGIRYNGRPRTQPWEYSEISVDAQRYAKDNFVSLILW